LCFHGIGRCRVEREPGEARYWIDEKVFLGVLDGVAARQDVHLSFDDGNVSDVDVALPALRERGLSATFFALAGRLDEASSLSAADLRDLRAAGMVIGNHGWRHISWRGLGPRDEQRELVEARSVLEEACGADVTTAALPLGRYDRAVLGSLRRTGYQTVFTSDRFPVRPSSWLQARYSVTADDTVESVMAMAGARWGSGEVRNLVASAVKRLR
ncbi:MAG TPA: polysaccharide deacetylase family protein, partial [Propionibacteriaceae bacterium]|nr:polysaccharide deacetylase family protein [Propionibacteriaceae bacterium]